MLLSLVFACAFHVLRTGLVAPEGERVYLKGYQGGRLPLLLDTASDPLRYLDGCVVEVTGDRTPAGLVVTDWTVKDAGDGSSGFVGVLRPWGARVVVDDRNTGTTLVIADDQAAALRPFLGEPVLLVGTVVGTAEIRVLAWRRLVAGGSVR